MKSDLRSSLVLMVSAALGGGAISGCASAPAPAASSAPAPHAVASGGQAGSCGAHPAPAPAAPGGQAASCGASGSCGARQPASGSRK